VAVGYGRCHKTSDITSDKTSHTAGQTQKCLSLTTEEQREASTGIKLPNT